MPSTERRIVTGGGYATYPADNVNTVRMYDSALTEIWKYSHPATVYAVAMDADGNVYLGCARAGGVTTRKLDKDGNLLWSADHGGNVLAIAVGADGTVVTGGNVVSGVTTRSYAADGTPGWTANHANQVRCVDIDSAGNVYTGGYRYTTSYPQGHVRKYNSSGTLQWTLDVGSSAVSYIYGIAAEDGGDFYVTGYRYASVTTRKYDQYRDVVWEVDEGGNGNALSLDSGAVYTGFSRNSSTSLRKRALANGAETWAADSGFTVYALATDADGNIYTVSWEDSAIRKWNSSGTQVDSVTTPPFQPTYAIAVTDIAYPDLSVIPPGLGLSALASTPWPTAFHLLSAGMSLGVLPVSPDLVTPAPPSGDGVAVYRAYLGITPPLGIPIISLQCHRRQGDSSWLVLSLAIPSIEMRDILLSCLGYSVIVYAGIRQANGAEELGEFLRAVITDTAINKTVATQTAKITARIQYSLGAVQTRAVAGIEDQWIDGGRRKIRCHVNPALRPGDTVDTGTASWVAHNISYFISAGRAYMDVQEAP